jgi:peroxiredoxin
MRSDDLYTVPAWVPIPVDDGAASHLIGRHLPPITLPATAGPPVRLDALGPDWTVLYCYPRTGRPDADPPAGWDEVPGARGCTPQACSYRDHYAELRALNAQVYGVSTQATDYQQEMAARLHLPYPVLSDADFRLTDALGLPTFDIHGMRLIRRLTLLVQANRIEHCFYPVFPPDADADRVIQWLRVRAPGSRPA